MTIPNPFVLLFNILLRPSKWQQTVTQIDPELPLEFSLVELTRDHWRNQTMRRVLLNGYVILPLILFGACLIGHLLFGRPIDGVIAAFAFTAIIGLTFGITVSAAVGIAVLAVVGTSAALLWSDQQVILFDMIFSLRFGHLFGLSSALMLIGIANCTRHTVQKSFRQGSLGRQVGGVMLGMIASLVITAGATYMVLTIINARQTQQLPGNTVGIALALLPTLLLGLAVFLQSQSWRKATIFAIATAAFFMYGFGRIGSEYGLEFGGNELLIGMSAVTISFFFILSILPFTITRRFVGTWPAAVAGASGGLAIYGSQELIFSLFWFRENILLAIALLLVGLFFGWVWSAVAYLFEAAWNTLIYRLDSQHDGPVRWLTYHAAFCDEIQRFPFFELDDYLVMAVERGIVTEHGFMSRLLPDLPADGESIIQFVGQSRQQWAAQSARAELDARRLERLNSVEELANTKADAAAGLLSTTAGLMLRNFAQLGGDISAALTQPSPYNRRLVLSGVAHDLENLKIELGRDATNPVAIRYQPVAEHWHKIVTDHIDALDSAAKTNQQIPSPYIVGVPLTRSQEMFVGRTDVARYVEDILRRVDHPPLLLYGARRMGKTSLLYQLSWMLPRRILPLVVDLQGPVSLATTDAGFLFAFARGIRMAAARNEVTLPELSREELKDEPFTVFDEWLRRSGQAVVADGRDTVLLALDEFEALDASLAAGVLEERAILGMLRHIVQHSRGIKLLLSGSHTLAEFRRWSSYLINAQVLKLEYLTEAEARELIETPIPDFPLRYEPDAVRRVLDLTRGHPYLVQLACMEVVAYKNKQEPAQRFLATVADVDANIAAMLERGQQFFADIELNQVDENGRGLLRWLAKQGLGYSATEGELAAVIGMDTLSETTQQLILRSIIESQDGGYSIQVELVRHWFEDGSR